MNARLKLLQQIYARLATLESDREEARINNKETYSIDMEMTELRKKLQVIMNSPCPVLKEGN